MEPEVLSRTYPDIIRSAAGVGPDATSRTKSVQSCGDNRERARPAVQGCRMDLAAGSHHERQATSGQLSLASLRKRGRCRGGRGMSRTACAAMSAERMRPGSLGRLCRRSSWKCPAPAVPSRQASPPLSIAVGCGGWTESVVSRTRSPHEASASVRNSFRGRRGIRRGREQLPMACVLLVASDVVTLNDDPGRGIETRVYHDKTRIHIHGARSCYVSYAYGGERGRLHSAVERGCDLESVAPPDCKCDPSHH